MTATVDTVEAASTARAAPAVPSGWRRRVVPVLLALIFPACVLAAWQFASGTGRLRIVATPHEVALMMWDFAFGGIYDDAYSGTLYIHLYESMRRVYGGFALAALVAIPLGLLIGRVKVVRQMLDPTFQILRPIPVTAWLPLSMIFFGLGPSSAISLVFLGAFYPILLNTVFGVRHVDPKLFEAAAMLGCSGSAMFRRVVLPAALPSIFNGLRLGLGFAWVVIVVGEMTGVPTGLGAAIMDGRTLSRTDLIISGMIVIGIAGFVSDKLVLALNNRLLRWNVQHG
ncbi:MAG TPA: ABC transporter permease [Candidatus Sulfotelmatobacter sp.]|nr:ABC transporter permease [Candidatus Sulfotelmatobacter sp.]